MCCRIFLDYNMSDIISRYNPKYYNDAKLKSGEGFPSDSIPVITYKDSKILMNMKWGFPITDKKLIINSRAETIFEKSIFKDAIKKRRCIIPVCAFFEWQKDNNRKIKYKISVKNSKLFSLAAIYDNLMRFSIITTEANDSMKKIHGRMPVILEKDDEESYLSNSEPSIKKLLKPYRNDGLIFYKDDNKNNQISMFD